jgi:hypothetical protein
MKLISIIAFAVMFGGLSAHAAYDSQHASFTQLLSTNVKDGVVNYEGIKANAPLLEKYLGQVAEVSKAQYDKFGKEEQMAYLINAYNAFTLKMISDFYPVGSIKDIGPKVGGGFFGAGSKQWKVSEYELNGKKVSFQAMGKAVTLDEIEHENLRPIFKDARVHFALVCGAVSCPFLRSEAYTSSKLSEQLDAQGKQFLADAFRNRYDESKKTLYLSKIFDWFSKDFKRDGGGKVYDFVKKYMAPEVVAKAGTNPDIEYITYDWSLNSKAGRVVSSK